MIPEAWKQSRTKTFGRDLRAKEGNADVEGAEAAGVDSGRQLPMATRLNLCQPAAPFAVHSAGHSVAGLAESFHLQILRFQQKRPAAGQAVVVSAGGFSERVDRLAARSGGQQFGDKVKIDLRCFKGGLVVEGRVVVHDEVFHSNLARGQKSCFQRSNASAKVNNL